MASDWRAAALARRRSRLPRLKATTTVVPKSMAAKGHDDHVKAIGQPHPGHGLFSQPADKEGAQHPHQQHTGIFQQNGHSERADFAPVQHTITLTFFKPDVRSTARRTAEVTFKRDLSERC